MTSSLQPTIEPAAKQVTQQLHTDTSHVEMVLVADIGGTGGMAMDGDMAGGTGGDTQETAALQDGRAATGAAATFRRLATTGLNVDRSSTSAV